MGDRVLNVRTFREYDMESKTVENSVERMSSVLNSLVERVPVKLSLFLGVMGLIISFLSFYFLLSLPLMRVNFGLKFFQTLQRPTKLSGLLEEVGQQLEAITAKDRLLTFEKFPEELRVKIQKLKAEAKASSKWGLLSGLNNSVNAEEFASNIRDYLEDTPLHFSSYFTYFINYLFSLRSHRIDLFIIFVRALLIGFLALFSARFFFERFPINSET